ncbi:MAG: tRNA(Ile)-lysidine synthetase, partial [Gammaproteobacteria bacterium]|nr:tRNA(Ile)-lysidine synthetase [Gammaproteobacteria bacterium]
MVAYSGGLDSHVLLHSVSAKCEEFESPGVVAVHVNHGLSKHASAWSAHCADQCEKLEVSFTDFSVDALPASGESPEAAARTARYRAFADFVREGDCLLTAHHQDDQAE